MLSMPRIVRPDPHRFWRARNLGPPLDRPLADPLSETKNWRNLLTGRRGSQVSHSLPAHLERFIGDEAIPDSRLGLNETWTCRIAFNLLSKVSDINAETNNRTRAYSVAVSLISRPFLILTSDFLPRWDA